MLSFESTTPSSLFNSISSASKIIFAPEEVVKIIFLDSRDVLLKSNKLNTPYAQIIIVRFIVVHIKP
jgi:hypothetical protein